VIFLAKICARDWIAKTPAIDVLGLARFIYLLVCQMMVASPEKQETDMAELPRRLNIVLLLIALANLATDIARLALKWSPSHGLHGAIKERMIDGHHDTYARASDADLNGIPQREIRPLEPSGTPGPWPDSRKSGAFAPSQMPLPNYRYHRVVIWYPDCYRPTWRYEQRCGWW
jgi:hypothetical protein